MSENSNQKHQNIEVELAQEVGATLIETILPMLGARWFLRCKAPIMGVIHILLCCIVVPAIVFNITTGIFSIVFAIIGSFLAGWLFTGVAELYLAYQRGGAKGVIQSVAAIVIVIPLVGWYICWDKADDTSFWSGETKLHKNAEQGDATFVKFWLFVGATIDKQDNSGETPLFEAVRKGHAQIVQILLKEGADVNLADENGVTPIQVAKREGYTEIVELLKAAGARE